MNSNVKYGSCLYIKLLLNRWIYDSLKEYDNCYLTFNKLFSCYSQWNLTLSLQYYMLDGEQHSITIKSFRRYRFSEISKWVWTKQVTRLSTLSIRSGTKSSPIMFWRSFSISKTWLISTFLMLDMGYFGLFGQYHACWCTGGRLNKKDGLTRCGDSHVKDKTS